MMSKYGKTHIPRPDLHDKILEVTMAMFQEQGIKQVKMDDIARKLSISKRTLYENFKDKTELLLACLEKAEADRNERLGIYYTQRKNVIELLLNVHEDILRFMRNASPAYFIDMERYYPKVYNRYAHEKEMHRQAIVDLLREGIGEGMIRSDINIEIPFKFLEIGTYNTFGYILFNHFHINFDIRRNHVRHVRSNMFLSGPECQHVSSSALTTFLISATGSSALSTLPLRAMPDLPADIS